MYLIVITIVIFTQIIVAICSFSISVIGKCFKDECCVGSRRNYNLKWVIHWHFSEHLILSNLYLIVITIVIFTHIII